jgi:hypothetical protein
LKKGLAPSSSRENPRIKAESRCLSYFFNGLLAAIDW